MKGGEILSFDRTSKQEGLENVENNSALVRTKSKRRIISMKKLFVKKDTKHQDCGPSKTPTKMASSTANSSRKEEVGTNSHAESDSVLSNRAQPTLPKEYLHEQGKMGKSTEKNVEPEKKTNKKRFTLKRTETNSQKLP